MGFVPVGVDEVDLLLSSELLPVVVKEVTPDEPEGDDETPARVVGDLVVDNSLVERTVVSVVASPLDDGISVDVEFELTIPACSTDRGYITCESLGTTILLCRHLTVS